MSEHDIHAVASVGRFSSHGVPRGLGFAALAHWEHSRQSRDEGRGIPQGVKYQEEWTWTQLLNPIVFQWDREGSSPSLPTLTSFAAASLRSK